MVRHNVLYSIVMGLQTATVFLPAQQWMDTFIRILNCCLFRFGGGGVGHPLHGPRRPQTGGLLSQICSRERCILASYTQSKLPVLGLAPEIVEAAETARTGGRMTLLLGCNSKSSGRVVSVPDGRRFGYVNVVCSCWCSHVWVGRGEKRGNGGWARWLKMGQLTLSMGPARAEVRSHHSK